MSQTEVKRLQEVIKALQAGETQFSRADVNLLKKIVGEYHRSKGISTEESEEAYKLYKKLDRISKSKATPKTKKIK